MGGVESLHGLCGPTNEGLSVQGVSSSSYPPSPEGLT